MHHLRLHLRFLIALALTTIASSAATPETSRLQAELQRESAGLTDWSTRYGRSAAQLDEGIQIAKSRMRLFREMAQTDPKAIIDQALTPEAYASLPVEIRRVSEQPISTLGEINVLCAMPPTGSHEHARIIRTVTFGGQTYPAEVYGRRLAQVSKSGIPLQGVIIDGTFIVDERVIQQVDEATLSPVTVIRGANRSSTRGVVGRAGGRFYRFASKEELLEADRAQQRSEQYPDTPATPSFEQVVADPLTATVTNTAATGNKTVLVIRLDFSDCPGDPMSVVLNGDMAPVTKAYGQNLFDTYINPFYVAASYGQQSYTTTVTGKVYRLSKTSAYYGENNQYPLLKDEAKALAKVDYPGEYDRYVYVFRWVGGQFWWSGLGGGSDVWINGDYTLRVLAHELGHCNGVLHANLWQASNGDPISSSGTHVEYGDLYDIMGSADAGGMTDDFNPHFKNYFGWLAAAQTKALTESGTHRLYMFDTPTRRATDLVALTYKTSDEYTYIIGYRGAFSSVEKDPYWPFTITSGAYVIRTSTQWPTATELLDLVPSDPNFNSVALPVGETFADTANGFSVRLLGIGGSGADRYIDVRVDLFDPKKFPSLAVQNAALGKTATIATRTITAPVKTQLLIDGILWQESSTANAVFNWEARDFGEHLIEVKAWFSDGTIVTNSSRTGVGIPEDWKWLTPLPQGNAISSLAYAFGRWWGIGQYGTLVTSSDGQNWSRKVMPVKSDLVRIATDGVQLLLTCQSADAVGEPVTGTLWRSRDGEKWSIVTSSQFGNLEPRYIDYVNGVWLMSTITSVSTSTDAVNWTTPITPLSSSPAYFTYGNGYWVVASYGEIAKSADLKSWTRTGSFPLTTCAGIAFNKGTWLAVFQDPASTRYQLYVSKDLNAWRVTGPTDIYWWPWGVTETNGLFVISTEHILYFSTDGDTWNQTYLPNSRLCGIQFRNGTYFAAGLAGKTYSGTSLPTLRLTDSYPRLGYTAAASRNDGAIILTLGSYSNTDFRMHPPVEILKDGTFTPCSISSSDGMAGIATRNGVYAVVGSLGRIYTSTDGETWCERPSGTTTAFSAIAATDSGFVAVGDKGVIVTSTDGMTWVRQFSGTNEPLLAVATDGQALVATGTSGVILSSPDGMTWRQQSAGISAALTNVVWQRGIGFCMVVEGGVFTASDGTNWTRNRTGNNWTSAAATPYGLVLAGNGIVGTTVDGAHAKVTCMPANAIRLFHVDDALYVSDDSGLITTPLQPALAVSPNVLKQPVSQSVQEGDPASFSVEATGSGPMTYQWYQGGIAISGATDSQLTITHAATNDAGNYTVRLKNNVGTMDSAIALLTVRNSPIHITSLSAGQTLLPGTSTTLSISVTSEVGALTYQWYRSGQAIAGATLSTLALSNITPVSYGNYTVTVTCPTASVTSGLIAIAPPITLVHAASSLTMPSNATCAFTVQDIVTGVTYQWYRNGTPIAGATNPTWVGQTSPSAKMDTIAVVAFINGTSTTSDPIVISPSATNDIGRLANISVITRSGTGDEALTLGFVSNGSKPVLIRAIGPSLTQFGVTDPVADPAIALFNGATFVTTNEDWGGTQVLKNSFDQTGAFPLETNSKDAALLTTVSGLYSAHVLGGTGIALIEVYDATSDAFALDTARLINLSCRALVGPADRKVAVGFAILGSTAKTILIRGVGPALKTYGVGFPLADPKLTLFTHGEQVATNDDWGRTVPTSTFLATGAFMLTDASSKDAALVLTLPPGVYSVQLAPTDESTGIALAELYELP